MRPGSSYTFPVVVTVPANSSLTGSVQVAAPVDQTAVMTVTSISLVSRTPGNLISLRDGYEHIFTALIFNFELFLEHPVD